MAAISSKHIRSTSELLLVVPVKSGFVASPERLTSYATRLQWLLQALAEPAQKAAEETLLVSDGPIDALSSIYNTQWAVVDRPQQAFLYVSAVFDRSWEDYFNLLVDVTGPLLDLIFCHCVGYEGHTCEDGYEPFADWIRRHQVQTSFFHTELRDVTVDDLRLQRLRQADPSHTGPLPKLREQAALVAQRAREQLTDEVFERELSERSQRALLGLYELRAAFPDVDEGLRTRTSQQQFDSAIQQVFKQRAALLAGHEHLLPDEVSLWWSGLRARNRPQRVQRVLLSHEDLDDIQGNLLTPYQVSEGEIALVCCNSKSITAALLTHFADHVHSEAAEHTAAARPEQLRINVALTYPGLRRLELDPVLLSKLPQEFCEGMERRAALVGDVGRPNHPAYWQRPLVNGGDQPLALDSVDLAVWLEGGTVQERDAACQQLKKLGARVVHRQPLQRGAGPRWRDAFGFTDPGDRHTTSQPVPNVSLAQRDLTVDCNPNDVVELGELLLGYPDQRGQVALCADPRQDPGAAELFRHGSFLVMRKLEQHPLEFQEFLRKNEGYGGSIVGRDPDGRPLVAKDARDNTFHYDDDATGALCPLHAHVRRANPRAATEQPVPRIMRRSFAYEDADASKGLLFLAFNASIANQFEVIQRWLNGGNSTGLASAHNDVLTAAQPWSGLIPGAAGESATLKPPKKPLVSLRWGLYLFSPSRTSLRKLAALASRPAARTTDPALLAQGQALMTQLDQIADPTLARSAWRQLLEQEEWRPAAAAVWAVLRERARTKHTPYGLLIGDRDHALEVLSDDGQRISVREYWSRLNEYIGEHYLGLDERAGRLPSGVRHGRDTAFEQRITHCPHHDRAHTPNEYIRTQLSGAGAFERALQLTRTYLSNPEHPRELRALAKFVIGQLAGQWLGLPGDPTDLQRTAALMDRFSLISRCCFQPYPEDELRVLARQAGAALRAAYEAAPPKQGMYAALHSTGADTATLGAIVGFAPPAIGNLISILVRWLESGELARQQQLCHGYSLSERRQQLYAPLMAAWLAAPVPPLLYRTVIEPYEDAVPGELAIIGLQSVTLDERARGLPEPWAWLFGGAHHPTPSGQPVHGCPGREPAFEAVLGVATALLECTAITPVTKFRFSFAGTRSPAPERQSS